MPASQSSQSAVLNVQPHSVVDAVDLRRAVSGMTASNTAVLTGFFDALVDADALSVRLALDSDGSLRCQTLYVNGSEEARNEDSELLDALKVLRSFEPTPASELGGVTLHVITERHDLDVSYISLSAEQDNQVVLRGRAVEPVPTLLDTLALGNDELRHIRSALTESKGLLSVGTRHRRHLEDWQRAICRELSAPDRSVVSLAPRLLEELPRVSQSVLPPGERWDQRLWQLASAADADVLVLIDDGTHGYAPDQLSVLAERCLVVQILQVPDFKTLVGRTPHTDKVHRMVMHWPLRKLCEHCSEAHSNPSRVDYPFLDRALPTLSDGVNAWLSASQTLCFKKPQGCSECHSSGHAGETSVVDAMADTTELSAEFDLHDIKTQRTHSLVDLARQGDISLDEVRRILDAE